ncbi:LptF/LptG family permease [Phycisphaerales bacterium AB-hyl4]|uniref:LptF/LptG family permease n=1 Tax=Natronomicrosphaera hydrolytica TaxID=3242702 RepID=A0ABV4U841_9BACT
MPWTLYRYILVELLKLLAITTAVLVTVISFAAAVKPLSEGLLSPAALVRFVGFSAPTMIVFALPFAAAFASTLTFIRMAADNEVLACSASGLSYRSVLLPPIILGVAMTMGLFFTANYVIPYFYAQARQTIEHDIVTLLVNDLNSGKAFDRFPDRDLVVFADRAGERPPPVLPEADIQPTRLIELAGVAVGQLDHASRLRMDITAQRANILLFHQSDQSWATIALRDARYFDPTRGTLGEDEAVNIGPLKLPNPFRDRPKMFSLPQLRQIEQQPALYDRVREERDSLINALSGERLRQLVRSSLENDHTGNTVILASTGYGGYFALRAPDVRPGGTTIRMRADGDDPVTVEFAPAYEPGGVWAPTRRYEAQQATLGVEQISPERDPNLRVELTEVRVYDARLGGRSTEHSAMTLPRLLWPEPVLADDPRQIGLEPLINLARQPGYRDAPGVETASDNLQNRTVRLMYQITALIHDRAASAVACLLLTVLGSVLSIHLKGQMTLVVYFWSFLLAIITILLIYAGENVATSRPSPAYLYMGLGLLWSGNVLLAVITGWVYCRLARN